MAQAQKTRETVPRGLTGCPAPRAEASSQWPDFGILFAGKAIARTLGRPYQRPSTQAPYTERDGREYTDGAEKLVKIGAKVRRPLGRGRHSVVCCGLPEDCCDFVIRVMLASPHRAWAERQDYRSIEIPLAARLNSSPGKAICARGSFDPPLQDDGSTLQIGSRKLPMIARESLARSKLYNVRWTLA